MITRLVTSDWGEHSLFAMNTSLPPIKPTDIVMATDKDISLTKDLYTQRISRDADLLDSEAYGVLQSSIRRLEV